MNKTENVFLRSARQERGWSQRRLAELVGVEEQTIRTWERGTRIPSLEFRTRLCQIFELSPDALGLRPASPLVSPHVAQEMHPIQALSSQPNRRDENRYRMIKQVHSRWIAGILEHSLYRATLIEVGLWEQPEVVENPWHLEIQESNVPSRPLPMSTRVVDVYDDTSGELLILGEPGAGKTTLLLDLARELLDRAEQHENHPIPVIFHLSSWAEERQSLATWLIEELHTKYQVPYKLGTLWIKNNQLLLLLDGLDEVAREYRSACVSSINNYRQEHGLVPLVICSRSTDYLTQPFRLLLRTAAVVQPLTQSQDQNDEWITMAKAAEAFGVSAAKISRMAANNEILTRINRRDKRVRLVSIKELRRYFEENPNTGEEE